MKYPRLEDYPNAGAWLQAIGRHLARLEIQTFPSDRSKWTYITPSFEPYDMKRGNWTGD